MQKFARVLLFCISLALPSCTLASAQEPTDPKALMLAASKINNLAAPDAKPWHIRASFQLLDDQGAVTDEGTYEEFWGGYTKFKQIFTGKAFAQTNYGSEKGDLRADAHGDVPLLLMNARQDLVGPLPTEESIQPQTYKAKSLETGSLKLTCLNISAPYAVPTYCFGSPEPVLRISAYPAISIQVLRNRILHFDGRTIAGDLKLMRNGKPELTVHVDSIEELDTANVAILTPPPDAVLVPRRIAISNALAQGLRIYAVQPEYPITAKNAHITGTVVLKAIIGKDGNLKDLKVIQGPDALQHSALDAVRQWRYKPYLLNGNPVEVDTTINVVFQLGN